jgi:hypothetical protein
VTEREIYYRVEEVDPSHKYRLRISLDAERDRDAIAAHVAENYAYEQCDPGDDWPVEVHIYEANGALIGHFRIEREMVPSFCAVEIGDD